MKKTKDGITIVQCDKCLQWVRAEHDDYPYADNGCQIHINGGYGEFIDIIGNEELPMILLCHDCTLELFRSIPKLRQDLIKNGHSVSIHNPNHPLCCEYSWCFDETNHEVKMGTKENFKPQKTFEIEEQ